MKLLDYLKDKFIYFGAAAVGIGCAALFLALLRYNGFAILFVGSILLAAFAVPLIVEYAEKHRFYRELVSCCEELDKKYLLAELVDRPDFLEGELIYEVLRAAGKSMADEAAANRGEKKEYREYIELWVHEVKTPIASSRLLIENHKDAVTESIGEELDKVEAYLEQALYYARAGTLEQDYIIRSVRLSEAVNKVIRKNARELIAHKIKIERNGLDQCVHTDEKWLEFILNQLIVNSIKYRSKEAKLRITAVRQRSSVVLSVIDNGIGMNEKDVGRAFDKGYTGGTGRRFAKSTGMGLYLCRQLCCKMGLSIGLDSKEGEGTTVRIVFPSGNLTKM